MSSATHNIFDPALWAAVPFHFWSFVFFAFGCIVGSFLNVVIHRLPLGQSIVSPPSHCPHCQYSIPAYLNIPLVTWLSLKGRCKNCGAPISVRYFLVELLTGLMFAGCWLAYGHKSALLALVYCLFVGGLIAATFIDFEHYIIPDEITIGGTVVGVLCSVLVPQLHAETTRLGGLTAGVIGAAVGGGLIYGVVRGGKLLFGRFKPALDPGSRVVFTETEIVLPPKYLALETLVRRSSGLLAFRVQKVELPDRCYVDVLVGISADKVIVADQTFDRSAAPCLEMIVEDVLSPGRTASLANVRAGVLALLRDSLRDSLRLLLGLIGIRKWPRLGWGSHLVFADDNLWLYRDTIPFEEVFFRKSDTIRFLARKVETRFGTWNDTPVRIQPDVLWIGDATFNPEAVSRMEVVTDAMVVPREAMGLGDVKFMAAIGAFLGWPAVFFSLMFSALIGTMVILPLVVMGRRELSTRIPYGPYIAAAAALWVFLPEHLREIWLWNLQLLGSFFGGPPPSGAWPE